MIKIEENKEIDLFVDFLGNHARKIVLKDTCLNDERRVLSLLHFKEKCFYLDEKHILSKGITVNHTFKLFYMKEIHHQSEYFLRLRHNFKLWLMKIFATFGDQITNGNILEPSFKTSQNAISQ